jgi:hypothetical protein
VDGVEAMACHVTVDSGAICQANERVAPDEGEGVVGLVHDVHAHHVEAGPVVAHRGPAGTTEQVQQSGPHHADTTGAGVLVPSPRRMLQLAQLARRFPRSVSDPPKRRGITWSTWVAFPVQPGY